MDNLQTLTTVLMVIIVIICVLLVALVVVYFSTKNKKDKKIGKAEKIAEEDGKVVPKSKTFAVQSVIDFMEFDRIEDNMIIQKDGFKYIMVIECQGINYDLMSEVEKNAVEEGFIQFLNTIRHPVQLYVQTRTINLEGSLQGYRARVKQIEDDYHRQEMRYREMKSSGNYTKEQLDRVYYELTKQRNLTEYGKDIIYSTEKMSLNKKVLNQSYYVIVPYIPEESGTDDFDKDEITSMAFSELYTRCQSIIRTLAGCEVHGRILSSEELVELLYVAYNRDEQEVFGLDKALRAGYDELYSTAEDVLDKKMRLLDEKIEEEAFNKANEKVIEAQSAKEKALQKKENNMDNLIDNLAKLIIEQNTASVGYDVAQDAINSINKDKEERKAGKKKASKEGGTKEDGKEKTKRRRTTKTA